MADREAVTGPEPHLVERRELATFFRVFILGPRTDHFQWDSLDPVLLRADPMHPVNCLQPNRQGDFGPRSKKPKKRAGRKPARQWDRHKAEICDFYATNTLEDTVEFLIREHGFEVNKRQLVYRLNKWGSRKYNVGEGDMHNHAGPGDGQGREGSETTSIDGLSDADRLSFDRDMLRPEMLQPICCAAAVESFRKPGPNIRLAVCDNEGAWNSCNFSNRTLQAMTTLARSAESDAQCGMTLAILQEETLNQQFGPCDELLCYLFHALVSNTSHREIDGHILQMITESLTSVLGREESLVLRKDGSADFIFYALLDFIEGVLRRQPASPAYKLLDNQLTEFHEWVFIYPQPDQGRSIQVLRGCAQWCHHELLIVTTHPAEAVCPNLRAEPSQSQELWLQHHQIFGALWRRLMKQPVHWMERCVDSLNLPHEEVLSYICWVIADIASRQHKADRFDGDVISQLFVSAEEAAKILSDAVPDELWESFRTAFRRFNTYTITENERNKTFKAGIVEEFNAFVVKTLDEVKGAAVRADDALEVEQTAHPEDDCQFLLGGESNEGIFDDTGYGSSATPYGFR